MKTLKPFQIEGSKFLQIHPHALLADEPGLGKTIQALDAGAALGFTRWLIVCPASVRTQWKDEIYQFGRRVGLHAHGAAHFIISYEEAVKMAKNPGPDSFDVIVLDEAHYLKTPESQRTQAIFSNPMGLARRALYKWCLTGTPALNRPRELYPILKTLAKETIEPYDTFPKFAQRFCGAYFDGERIDTRGASHLDDLATRLSRFMLRRTKAEVLTELPSKIISKIPLELNAEEFSWIERAETEIMDRESYISSVMENFSALGDQAHLLHAVGIAKVRAVAAFVRDLLETEEKIVVFAHHREVISQLVQKFSGMGVRSVVYQGGMSDIAKASAVDTFVCDAETRVFIGNLEAAGTGLDGLQRVSASAVFAENSWVPGQMGQALDRLHRIGQAGNMVNGYITYAPRTIEGAVLATQDRKMNVLEKLGLGIGWN